LLKDRSGVLLPVLALIFLLSVPATSDAATLQYPNLRTLPPRDLRFDTTDVSPNLENVIHNVLRFSNTVWNGGAGPLELRGTINPETKTGTAYQRIYNNEGGFQDFLTGNTFYWHAAHQHYHFDNWGRYELWTKADYDNWIASGRKVGNPIVGSKTTSCVEDEEFIKTLPNQPYPPAYEANGCFPNSQNLMLQGLSPGWGDTYDYYRPDQWIDLGAGGKLADGTYVLRSVVDPLNKIYESPEKAESNVEGEVDNEAITIFKVESGKLVDSNPPDGSIRINDIDPSTASPNVTVKVLGRDDISGVSLVKLSNDGQHWSSAQTYTGSGSTAQAISWSLVNPAYGGNESDGTKTVYAEFQDVSGKWSSPVADTILLDRTSGTSAYSKAVLADGPAGYWRLGDTGTTTAVDSAAGDDGTYTNGPAQGQTSLLAGDAANAATAFDGSNDYVKIPTTGALSPTGRLTLETWIKPTLLPSAGSFASIVTKPESYSLQFNGPRLEFTIIQNGVRKRLQAPSGAVATGQVYHVVGTYDGNTQRLYLNGKEVASTPLSGEIATNANSLSVGSWNGKEEFFKGTIDEVAVYSIALSGTRIATHYQAGIGGEPPDTSVKAPSGLTATAAGEKQINLQWVDNSTNETEFVIQRDTNSKFTSPTTLTTWAENTTYSDVGLTPETTYFYRVRAHNATDTSEWSNTASAKTWATLSGYRGAVLADSPVSYWRLDEPSGTTAADERGANPGTYVNGPTLGAAGLLGSDTDKAVSFDGTNDQVKIASSNSLNLTSPFTLEAWIKPTSLPSTGSFVSILTKAESYSLQLNGPRLEFTVMQNGTRKRLQAPSGAVAAGGTYHVLATADGTTQRLYLNGKEVASTPLSGGPTSTTNPLFIGSWNGKEEFFKGTIDEVAVYNTALTAARDSAHYSAGAPAGAESISAPSALSATAASSSQINLKWTDNSGNEEHFALERSTSSGFSSPQTFTLPVNTTAYSDTGLAENTTYYYRVKATNSTETSGYSNTANAITQSATLSGYRGAVLADSPVSYWRLDEPSGTTAADERGANPGTYVNGPTLGAAGLLGSDTDKAVSFDGTNDQVKIASSNSLNLTSPFTLEAWIKPTSLPSTGSFVSILTKAESYSLQLNGPRLEFTVMQNGTRKRLQAPSGAVAAGGTYHVLATADGTTQRLYLNGKEVASTPLSGGPTSTTNPLFIGSWNGKEEFFKGTIDEVAVYNTALTAARDSAHYSAGTSTTTAAATVSTDPFLLASYSNPRYSIRSEPTTFDYCQLEKPVGFERLAILKGAKNNWLQRRS
jgi:concanavalin A-like lectin/glucanase superfamily protein/lysyl oxidase/fibronectin type III domain protein